MKANYLKAIAIIMLLNQCVDKLKCDRYGEYLKHDAYGRVIRKYIDNANHARQTILLEHMNTESVEIEVTYFATGLYDSLSIGDIVSKDKDSLTTTLIKGGRKIEFTVQ